MLQNNTHGIFSMNGNVHFRLCLSHSEDPGNWAVGNFSKQYANLVEWRNDTGAALELLRKGDSESVKKIAQLLAHIAGIRHQNLPGRPEPFYLIVPNLDIGSPHGDPTIVGNGGANATNEIVFDDKIPSDEQAGQCVFSMEVSDMNLDTDPRTLVMEQIKWLEPPNVGNVAAEEVELEKVPTVKVVYSKMPDRWDAFGRKQLTLAFAGRDWKWYQDVEFFFDPNGTAGKGGGLLWPNWFFYWQQSFASPGNNVTVAFVNEDSFQGWPPNVIGLYAPGLKTARTEVNPKVEFHRKSAEPYINGDDSTRYCSFAGIWAHEADHHALFEEWWGAGGLIDWTKTVIIIIGGKRVERPVLDADRDFVPDAWEKRDGNIHGFVVEPDKRRQSWHDQPSTRVLESIPILFPGSTGQSLWPVVPRSFAQERATRAQVNAVVGSAARRDNDWSTYSIRKHSRSH